MINCPRLSLRGILSTMTSEKSVLVVTSDHIMDSALPPPPLKKMGEGLPVSAECKPVGWSKWGGLAPPPFWQKFSNSGGGQSDALSQNLM